MKLLCICLLFLGCATDPWTKEQVMLQGVSTTLAVMDWGQTLDIVDKPDQFYEVNPIIGKHPSRHRVNTYFALTSLAKIAITHILPSEQRKWWLGLNIAISGYFVKGNYRGGLRVNF